eukprot:GHVQ01034125.1.p1 GENE.GHVQ01034125.1~~GHVQ01034125.1.p1  ORF type:complete len:327 (-),score=47.60 GHVQ01034125.1:229-1209(-)
MHIYPLQTPTATHNIKCSNELLGAYRGSCAVLGSFNAHRERRELRELLYLNKMGGRGIKKHLKRVRAPSHWMLDKLTGIYAPKPSPGPHKLRECIPLVVLLRNKLKYALTYNEVKLIVMQRLVQVDGKVRTDHCFPAGYMDVVTIEKTQEQFRLLYDTKGRFVPHKIRTEEALYKLCRIKSVSLGVKGVPTAVTHDGRTLRFIHPEVKPNDTVRIDIKTGKVLDWIKFENGATVMATGGHNVGRVGVITHRERHPGSFDIVHMKDAKGHAFATRMGNVFLIGTGAKTWVSLPREGGIRLNMQEDRLRKLQRLYGVQAGGAAAAGGN